MDPPLPDPNLQDDDVFFDVSDQCPFHHCSDDSPESSPSDSCLSDPEPPSPPPPSIIRRRSIRHLSPVNELSDTNSTDVATTKSQNLPTSKENEFFPVKFESDKEKVDSFPSPSVVTEERNNESTLTTASHDESLDDSADSVAELTDSHSSSLEYVAGLVIKAVVFQIKIFIMLMKCPILFMFHACMFCVDPFGTMKKGKSFFIGNLDRVLFSVSRFIGPSTLGWFNEHKSFWNVAFKCGWGLLWSIYVCCILSGLLVSSLVVSWFSVKRLVDKPFQMNQVLNFDYTKQTPVAFVPIISCSGVGVEHHSDENGIEVDRWINKRVIPSKQKVQVTVSLLVPESEYNANLGVFQIRVDFLSSNGNTIASSRQPTMLKFRSEPIRLITIFLKLVPLLTGYISETQTLDAKMRGFVEGDVPTSCLKVTLEQRAEYLPGAGIPQIYDSSIFIESELPLLKRIIWYWKMSMFIWIAMMAFVMELLVVLVCCWPMIIPKTKRMSSSGRSTGTQNNFPAPS